MARHEEQALWALAAGELDAQARARVEAHVASCEACARALAQVRQAREVLHTARPQALDVRWEEVDERVLGAAARRLARLERAPRWPWALAGACALALALVLLRPEARTPPPPPLAADTHEAPAPALIQVERAQDAWGLQEGSEEALSQGARLRAGASVRTPARASALLRLPDASRVQVAPDSEVLLARAEAEDVHLTVRRGRLAVRASHAPRRGFVVEAPGVRVSVVGTVFSVGHEAHGVSVAVLEGRVRVEVEGQPERFLSAGERLEVRPGERPPRPRPLSTQERQAFQALGVSMPAPAPHRGRAAAPPSPPPPRTEVARAPASRPEVDPSPRGESSPATRTEASAPLPVPPEATAEEPPAEFAPYPAPGSVEPTHALVPAESGPSGASATDALSSVDERFLQQAWAHLDSARCEGFLVGLAVLAEQSRVRDARQQARYLRARCFEERQASQAAAAEYRRYLREFPRGRYARQAHEALLP